MNQDTSPFFCVTAYLDEVIATSTFQFKPHQSACAKLGCGGWSNGGTSTDRQNDLGCFIKISIYCISLICAQPIQVQITLLPKSLVVPIDACSWSLRALAGWRGEGGGCAQQDRGRCVSVMMSSRTSSSASARSVSRLRARCCNNQTPRGCDLTLDTLSDTGQK